jgi:hypothetical protein
VAKFDHEDVGKLGQRSGQQEKLVHKKRYEKPSFRSEKVFETQALICGKVQPIQSQCGSNRKTS